MLCWVSASALFFKFCITWILSWMPYTSASTSCSTSNSLVCSFATYFFVLFDFVVRHMTSASFFDVGFYIFGVLSPVIKQPLIAIIEWQLLMLWAVRQEHLRCESCGCFSLESVEVNGTTVSLFLYVLWVFERLLNCKQLMWALTIDIGNANMVSQRYCLQGHFTQFAFLFSHLTAFAYTSAEQMLGTSNVTKTLEISETRQGNLSHS